MSMTAALSCAHACFLLQKSEWAPALAAMYACHLILVHALRAEGALTGTTVFAPCLKQYCRRAFGEEVVAWGVVPSCWPARAVSTLLAARRWRAGTG